LMARVLIGVSLTPKELELVRARVEKGGYESESDVIRDSLRQTLGRAASPIHSAAKCRSKSQKLAAAYRATSAEDRKIARDWAILNDPWPNT
jgi:Arc/MetJ-type ribon-helix-helix transcriptional regulator